MSGGREDNVSAARRPEPEDEDGEVIRVLVVEDDDGDYVITRSLLEQAGPARFSVDRAARYEEGLELITEGSHDAYLVDHMLGAKSGLDLVREAPIRRGGSPVIMLTGLKDPRIDEQARELGVADLLVKDDLSAVALERSIRQALRQGDSPG